MAGPDFPIAELLPGLLRSLAGHPRLVLEAPPGAGKTTQVPLALLEAPWRGDGRILMLEPRRVAARAAAGFMARQRGEAPGETVGYRIRFEAKVSARTRVEVVTEGILTRMVQDDPTLEGVAAVIFDEFHERHLAGDLGLAASWRGAMGQLDLASGSRVDWLTAVESRLFDQAIQRALVPTEEPVKGGRVGSPFGFRIDPITGRSALHTGLDFPGDVGTPIHAAAGGVVVVQEFHHAYGNMVEVDHGNGLITRYAHSSRVLVNKGDIVKRGQKIAEVGSTGRSTGPHLHFEVWFNGVAQDPQRFLAAGDNLAAAEQLAQKTRKP